MRANGPGSFLSSDNVTMRAHRVCVTGIHIDHAELLGFPPARNPQNEHAVEKAKSRQLRSAACRCASTARDSGCIGRSKLASSISGSTENGKAAIRTLGSAERIAQRLSPRCGKCRLRPLRRDIGLEIALFSRFLSLSDNVHSRPIFPRQIAPT